MKRWALAMVILAAMVAGARADNGWGIYGSYWQPGDWDGAAGAGGKISFEVVKNALFDIRATWFDDFTLDEDGTRLQVEAVPFEAGLTITTGLEPVNVYFCGGLSWYTMDGGVYQSGVKTDVDFDDEFGFYGGIGFEVPVSEDVAHLGATRITLFAEALYRYASVDEVSTGLNTFAGGDLGGFAANVGAMIRW
jgi:hypothetical protein